MNAAIHIDVTQAAFDAGVEIARLGAAGGVASFIGHVRGDDGVAVLHLDHHPVMTGAALRALAETAGSRWPLSAVSIIHRVGPLPVGAPIVFVGVASDHRAAALDACAFLIDRLKTDVPLWKREDMADGQQRWVEQRCGDLDRAADWN